MTALPPQPLSPLDGRYRSAVSALGEHLSEAGLNRARVQVEVEWLIYLTDHEHVRLAAPRRPSRPRRCARSAADFGQPEIDELADLEATTRHDVKAVEYLVRAKLADLGLDPIAELTHFACTSEDINNLSYALTVSAAVREVWLPKFRAVIDGAPRARRSSTATIAMLAHTHGQPATPDHDRQGVRGLRVPARAGARADRGHRVPRQVQRRDRHLRRARRRRPRRRLAGDLARVRHRPRPRLEPAHHPDRVARLAGRALPAHRARQPHPAQPVHRHLDLHLDGLLHARSRRPGATGSSTMPHKINPIRFENAEANLELSSALLDSLAADARHVAACSATSPTRPRSATSASRSATRCSRSTTSRAASARSPSTASCSPPTSTRNWEMLGEAIQTVIRAEITAGRSSIADPYALLKELTRGKRIGQAELVAFVDGLDIGDDAKARLLALTPGTYTGLASAARRPPRLAVRRACVERAVGIAAADGGSARRDALQSTVRSARQVVLVAPVLLVEVADLFGVRLEREREHREHHQRHDERDAEEDRARARARRVDMSTIEADEHARGRREAEQLDGPERSCGSAGARAGRG